MSSACKDISFSYDASHSFFSNFSLEIKHGERVGIVGRSGSGKSSLINLLLRFYEVDKGEITIAHTNINLITQDSLRSHIAMVTQDTSLLHRTIKENIAYSKPSASNKEIILAAKKAQAHKFIIELRDQFGNSGYDSMVGERGVKQCFANTRGRWPNFCMLGKRYFAATPVSPDNSDGLFKVLLAHCRDALIPVPYFG